MHRAESLACAWPLLLTADEELRRAVYDEARTWRNWCGYGSGVGLDACRGHIALSLGLVDDAAECFNEGLEWAEREGCPVEAGRNLQGLAAVAERRGDVAQALVLLDRAATYYQPRGIKLFLDQVIAKKVELQGITGDSSTSIAMVSTAVQHERPDISTHAAVDGTVTLLFSDIENSTAQNDRLGDARWMEILHAHNAVIRRNLERFGGHEVKSMGDGFMLVFSSPVQAVRYALATQGDLSLEPGLEGVRVRMGIHAGDAVREAGDFFGREVNYAARVAGCALGGEVLVSEVVRERVGDSGRFDAARGVTLKGFAGEHRVYAVEG